MPDGVLAHLRAGRAGRGHEHDRSAGDRSPGAGGGRERRAASSTRRSDGWPATPSAASRCSWSAPTEATFARVKPLLEAMGTTIHHCGGVGAGMRTKLVNNYLAIVSCQFNAEALALSQRFGLSLEKTLDVIHGTTATNGQLKIAWPVKVLKGDTEPGFTIDLAHKDLTLIVEAANAAQVPMPIAAAARESFSAARGRGHGAKDFSAMVDVLCDLRADRHSRGWRSTSERSPCPRHFPI